MPNPKTNTVTPNPVKAIEDINKGMVEFVQILMEISMEYWEKASFDNKALEEKPYLCS